MHSVIHDPYAGSTPSQRLAAAARAMRLAKVDARAKADTPINLRPKYQPPAKPEPAPVFTMADWVARQRQIPFPAPTVLGPPQIRDIQIACCLHFKIKLEGMLSDCQRDNFVRPRQVAMFLARELTGKSSLLIGRAFFRDHATILWGIRKIARLVAADEELARDIETIKTALASRFA
jgi:hypothetical protein